MIATARWGRKKPHAANLRAFDELVIPNMLHIEDMGGSLDVIVGAQKLTPAAETRVRPGLSRRCKFLSHCEGMP